MHFRMMFGKKRKVAKITRVTKTRVLKFQRLIDYFGT